MCCDIIKCLAGFKGNGVECGTLKKNVVLFGGAFCSWQIRPHRVLRGVTLLERIHSYISLARRGSTFIWERKCASCIMRCVWRGVGVVENIENTCVFLI